MPACRGLLVHLEASRRWKTVAANEVVLFQLSWCVRIPPPANLEKLSNFLLGPWVGYTHQPPLKLWKLWKFPRPLLEERDHPEL